MSGPPLFFVLFFLARQPHLHVASAAVCPGVVGGEGECHLFVLWFSLGVGYCYLCFGRECGDMLRAPC